MTLQWSDELSINIGQIDEQHKEIFKRYNLFLSACKSGAGRGALLELISFLSGYVADHFDHEEKLMNEYNYPDRSTHKKEHSELAGLVHTFKVKLETEGPTLSLVAEINRFLLDWLVDHIRKRDMELGAYLNQKWGLF
jgi:hemerythrin